MLDIAQRVEIYLAPGLRREGIWKGLNTSPNAVRLNIEDALSVEGIRLPLIIGSPRCGVFDYAVEGLNRADADWLVRKINSYEGYAAKAVNEQS